MIIIDGIETYKNLFIKILKMVEDIEDKEVWAIGTKPLEKQDISKDMYKVTSGTETLAEKLSWLPSSYWKTINQESESDDKITEEDVYEADLSDIEKELDGNPVAYRIFQALRKKGLRIFINTKTDISYTSGYNIILWRWPVTQQSKDSMELWLDAKDEEVYKTKLIHEMGHSLTVYVTKEMNRLFQLIVKIRQVWKSLTKLWNLDRYEGVPEKAKEDTVEFVRMYIQDPEKFKIYLWKIFKNENTQNILYMLTKDCIDVALSEKE